MTETERPEIAASGSADAPPDSAGASAESGGPTGFSPRRARKKRTAIVIAAVIAAIIIGGGILAPTIGLGPTLSSLSVALSPRPPAKVLVWRDALGAVRRAAVDSVEYEDLVAQQRKVLEAARVETRATARTRIEADIAAVFSKIEDRVPQYGEWYYRYTTKYLLMTHGAMGFWSDFWDRPNDEPFTLEEAIGLIQNHLTSYLEERYADKVLHPRETGARLQAAYDGDLAKLHEEWRMTVDDQQERVAKFLETQNGTIVPPGDSAVLDDEKLDWDFRRSDIVHKDSVTVRKFRRGLLSIAISRPRKYVIPGVPTPEPAEDATEGTDEISHVITNLFSAVIDPLAAEASALLAGTVAGGVAGTVTGRMMMVPAAAAPGFVLSAPLIGAAIGAAITVSTDITATRLEERMTRGAFEQSLRDTLAKTQKEITDNLIAALYEHADSQFIEGSRHLGPPTVVKTGSSVP